MHLRQAPFPKRSPGESICIVVHNSTTQSYGAQPMARSPLASDRKSVRTSVMLPEGVHSKVQALADSNQVSSAWVIRMAVQRFLDEHQGQLELPLLLSGRQGSDS